MVMSCNAMKCSVSLMNVVHIMYVRMYVMYVCMSVLYCIVLYCIVLYCNVM